MKKRWSVEINKLIFTHLVLIGIPTLVLSGLDLGERGLRTLHMAIATLFFISSVILIFESTVASFRRFATDHYKISPRWVDRWWDATKVWLGIGGSRTPPPWQPMPRCSFLIAAYLPNEQDIIIETLTHILNRVERPEGGLEVILAYNTPVTLPIEDDLRELSRMYPEVRVLRVEGSRSKAENLNAALAIVTGEVVCVLDADHHPAPDCFVRAWHWLSQGYDVVQGRNVIRNHAQNLLTQTIAIEFETTYGLSHAATSFLTDTSIFAGSNGYWRTSVLKQIRFNPKMLTEDIDATMRTLSQGFRIMHDRSIITSELAPTDLLSFWFQRKRWAQGWLEVSLKYQNHIWSFRKFTPGQKFYWISLLYYCEIYPLLAIQVFPILISLMLLRGQVEFYHNFYLWFITCFGFVSIFYRTAITAKISSYQYPTLEYLKHSLLLLPFLTLKNAIAIVSLYDHLSGNSDWWITPRGKQTPSRKPLLRKTPVSTARTSGFRRY